ncbi:MAG: Uncharacterised protein [Alphaproteobacteria bacterium UBA4588]|nr:MAG: Uncharacterised protein [Alphaproteobacteria bacterium UBA4588]
MFSTVKNWLSQNDTQAVTEVSESVDLAQLVTALLVEAAGADGKIADEESQLISEIISAQFELSDDEMVTVLSDAVNDYTDRIEIHGLMRRLRERADYEERIGVLELVWMVVLSDDRLDHIEAQLMRRLAGLLYISDVDSGLAAQTARTRLGIDAASA